MVQEPTFFLLYTAQEQFLLLYGWHEIYFWSLLVDMQMYPLYHKWKLIRSCWNAIVLSPRNTENSISHHFSAFPFANLVRSPTPSPFPQGFQRRFLHFILVPSEKGSMCLFIMKTLFYLNCKMLLYTPMVTFVTYYFKNVCFFDVAKFSTIMFGMNIWIN